MLRLWLGLRCKLGLSVCTLRLTDVWLVFLVYEIISATHPALPLPSLPQSKTLSVSPLPAHSCHSLHCSDYMLTCKLIISMWETLPWGCHRDVQVSPRHFQMSVCLQPDAKPPQREDHRKSEEAEFFNEVSACCVLFTVFYHHKSQWSRSKMSPGGPRQRLTGFTPAVHWHACWLTF